jgi:cellulose synthase (UDP-forming)
LGLIDVIRIPIQIVWVGVLQLGVSKLKFAILYDGAASLYKLVIQPITPSLHWVSRQLNKYLLKASARYKSLSDIESITNSYAHHRVWSNQFIRYSAYLFAGLLGFLCITTPFDTTAQLVFITLLMTTALSIRNLPGHIITLLMMILSFIASSRYLWWRITSTLNWDNAFDLTWGVLLLAAEIYTYMIMVTSYLQTAWPIIRKPAPLPKETNSWPDVDVFIPTYNEPIKVVKTTVLAAIEMDWPKDKLHIHILDDGNREVLGMLAKEIGANYITRENNHHAKAGNLNHALGKTSAEYVAIFDCDHIPTRAFLQMTMGMFLKDPKLALVQTPHHMYSPDAFERNLDVFRRSPNEGELFYQLIQPGNDLWNATFFCGSCAVLRREPLEKIGGIAVETVTEDVHTSLKLHRLGYNSAYLHIPLAGGLATESLSAHIRQRIRWARGMAQVFRLDNPFLGNGLTLMQRVCYSSAMLHFFNGIPRLIFLTAPLAFLLFHAYVIYAPAISIALYVIPHMIHGTLTSSRLQGKHRNSFWGEVYETVLSWYIARPTFVALFAPQNGKFDVTAKGGVIEESYFDWTISLPFIILLALNLFGFIFGISLLVTGSEDEIQTVALNMFWTSYNIILLGACIAVNLEAKQVRSSHRVELNVPSVLYLSNGKSIQCRTINYSEGGIAIQPLVMPELEPQQNVFVSLWRGEDEFAFNARVMSIVNSQIRLQWIINSPVQESELVQCTFGRADAWLNWSEGRTTDQPLSSLNHVISTGTIGLARLWNQLHAQSYQWKTHSPHKKISNVISSILPRNPKPTLNYS